VVVVSAASAGAIDARSHSCAAQLHHRRLFLIARDSCYAAVADENPARRILPIELSSVVTSLVTVTRELTKKLSNDQVSEVVSELCEQLRALANEKRGPNRPFSR
jgi:hypothetical protein